MRLISFLWLVVLPEPLRAFPLSPPATRLTSLAFTTTHVGTTAAPPHRSRPLLLAVPSVADNISIQELTDDAAAVTLAAHFLVDAFWLDPRHVVDSTLVLADPARDSLYAHQTDDLMDQYGARMGKRTLETAILTATDPTTGDVLGLVGIAALLFERDTSRLIPHDVSEALLKDAVASLGPKDRRKYKNASADEIATDLLSSDDSNQHTTVVGCLSNLAVSTKARRRGVAALLCAAAERRAEEWGYDAMLLRVEADNTAARTLYEDKLGYTELAVERDAVAFRADTQEGRFAETNADTLLLVKELS